MIEPARPHELAPLVADAYGLTEREREVTRLVARGLQTNAIAARMHLSSWTVQDHVKAIFEKVGVVTRGELVARVFFHQRAPQLYTAQRAGPSPGVARMPRSARLGGRASAPRHDPAAAKTARAPAQTSLSRRPRAQNASQVSPRRRCKPARTTTALLINENSIWPHRDASHRHVS